MCIFSSTTSNFLQDVKGPAIKLFGMYIFQVNLFILIEIYHCHPNFYTILVHIHIPVHSIVKQYWRKDCC